MLRTLVFVLFLYGGLVAFGDHDAPDNSRSAQQQRDDLMNVELMLKEAEELALARDRIAAQLMEVLADPTPDQRASDPVHATRMYGGNPPMKRFEAARLLAEMQYLPAIDILIQHIDRIDPLALSGEANPAQRYPCMPALVSYGDAVVPKLVEAYLIETDLSRRFIMFIALRDRSIIHTALRYVRGTEVPDDDSLRKENLERLTRHLEDYRSTLRPLPPTTVP